MCGRVSAQKVILDNNPDNNWKVTLASVTGQVGCLTIVLIALALIAGMWLDNLLDMAQPLFTIGFGLGSVPVTLYLIVRLVMRTTQYLHTPTQKTSPATEANDSDNSRSTET